MSRDRSCSTPARTAGVRRAGGGHVGWERDAVHQRELRLCEIPIHFKAWTRGKSKMSPGIAAGAAWRIWQAPPRPALREGAVLL